jgi:hypothetical protein
MTYLRECIIKIRTGADFAYVNIVISRDMIMIEFVERQNARTYRGLSFINAINVLINTGLEFEVEYV